MNVRKAKDLIPEFSEYLATNYSNFLLAEDVEGLIEELNENLKQDKKLFYDYGRLDIWLMYYFQQVADIDLTENKKIMAIMKEFSKVYRLGYRWYRLVDKLDIEYDTITTSYLYQSMFYNIDCKNIVIKPGVKRIPKECFWRSTVENISIPDGVTRIGEGAFGECRSLKSITIPDSVTIIDCTAFWYCGSLTNITIPNNVTSISDYTFYYCWSLKSINIPNNVTNIADFAFCGCESLTSIDIPNSVIRIGSDAFRKCISLTDIKIPNSVESIGDYAFGGCTSLTSIEIPSSVKTRIDFYDIFSGCNKDKLTIYTDNEYVKHYSKDKGIKWQPLKP